MAENRMVEFAKMYGLELGETFGIVGYRDKATWWGYFFKEDGLHHTVAVLNDDIKNYLLGVLLTGEVKIVKKPWKPGDNEWYYRIGGSSLKNADIFATVLMV